MNVDASVYEGANSFSVGMVTRDHQGSFLGAKTMRFAGHVSILEAELVGILEALKWVQELAYQEVIIESDSMLSVAAINKNVQNLLELGNLINQCHAIIGGRVGIVVDFVKKQANKVAHKLARESCALNSFVVFSSPPISLLGTLMSDVSML